MTVAFLDHGTRSHDVASYFTVTVLNSNSTLPTSHFIIISFFKQPGNSIHVAQYSVFNKPRCWILVLTEGQLILI